MRRTLEKIEAPAAVKGVSTKYLLDNFKEILVYTKYIYKNNICMYVLYKNF